MFDASELRDDYMKYKDQILKLVKNQLYNYERYGHEFSTLLIYSDKPIDLDICSANVRQSDSVYRLEDNLCLVVYDQATPESSMKAAQNFLLQYQRFTLKQDLCVAFAPAEQTDTAIDIASRLFIILEYALRESCTNSVVDIGQMR